jgi:flavin prenyltransferase
MNPRIVLGITGASGAVYAVRLLDVLLAAGYDVHLSISPAGQQVLKHELGLTVDLDHFHARNLLLRDEKSLADSSLDLTRELAGISTEESNVLSMSLKEPGRIVYHHYADLMAGIASGTFLTAGMVVCPCSGGTLSAIVHGMSTNLIHRAADVHLKEQRKLILVPRETPLSLIQIDNLRKAAEAGAVILPAAPGFYHGAKSIRDLVDFVVGKICDQLQIEHALVKRWGEPSR